MRTSRTTLAALVAALTTAGSAAVIAVAPAAPQDEDKAMAPFRAISERYQDPAAAVADGFVATDACEQHPTLGAMGFHYVHPGRMDGKIELGRPEVLLYAPGPDGTRVLTGVEYLAVDDDQDLSTDEDRPTLKGRPFDGPMPGHVPGMPVHYDLHVWAWQDNPAGRFTQWNRSVRCQARP